MVIYHSPFLLDKIFAIVILANYLTLTSVRLLRSSQ